ncbi:hypothetical protein SPAR55_1184 [Streptococcus pneumoniae SPAR55]|nr:hypothetical protein SPAR70_1282 [Streptococcus pneumoniae GA41410]EHE14618.1 hypothetical protein SPAR56_1426 [Streptococcus pneumoniae GA19077]EHE21617.1 hypothetical protein SPAR71_1359 [Streptococcus pneumoniae GA41437]EJG85623.1 hypothetical protein SPAR55_1184 [Streptococcus pneumoniae SPAR55]
MTSHDLLLVHFEGLLMKPNSVSRKRKKQYKMNCTPKVRQKKSTFWGVLL